jgi:hypothetical protein
MACSRPSSPFPLLKVHNFQSGMLRSRKIVAGCCCCFSRSNSSRERSVLLDLSPPWAHFGRVRVYAAFLARLSTEWSPTEHPALADMSFHLVMQRGENWLPAGLRPDPPEKAAPPPQVIDFCGSLCGRDFMRKNLRPWQLKPTRDVQFPFDILPNSAELSTDGKRVVTVTRVGFDMWQHRAVFSYSLDYSAGARAGQDAVVCVQIGDVLLEKVNGRWGVTRYSASVF